MRAERKNLIKSRKSLFSLRKAISSEAGNCVNQEGKAPSDKLRSSYSVRMHSMRSRFIENCPGEADSKEDEK